MVDFNLLERAGVITPYELLRNMLANYWHNKDNIGYFENPFQHGAENRSPIIDPKIKPDAGGPRLHIYQGQFIYTENEDQRVKLFLIDGFLDNNFIHIHPLANMEKWYPVIAKQISLNQGRLILPETMKAYSKYCKSKEQSDNRLRRRSAFVSVQENVKSKHDLKDGRSLSTVDVLVKQRSESLSSNDETLDSVGPCSTPSSSLTSSSLPGSVTSLSSKNDDESPRVLETDEYKNLLLLKEQQKQQHHVVQPLNSRRESKNPLESRRESKIVSVDGSVLLFHQRPGSKEKIPTPKKDHK